MSQQELLKRVASALDDAAVDYMLTGSFVSSLQGEPRATHDIDLVVAMDGGAVKSLVDAFPPPDYYLDELAVRDAINSEDMFNLLSINEGDKVDFWLLTGDPFDQSRFQRKRNEEIFGVALKVQSPEDTILAKLRWVNEFGGSDQHLIDALRVYEVQGSTLNISYLEEWADRLHVRDAWDKIKAEGSVL